MDQPYQKPSHIKRSTWTKLGSCYCVFYNDSLYIVIGPHWIFNLCVLPIMITITSAYLVFLVPKMEVYSAVIGTLILFSAILSYIITSLQDPGIVLRESVSDIPLSSDSETTLCPKCLIFKDKSISHCEDCDLCFKNLDHHCIFTGKCIASNNLLSFYLFLTSVFAFFIFSLFFVFTVDINR